MSGDAYLWVQSIHVIAVIFWVAGLFMLPRFYVYHMAAPHGSPEHLLWVERERRLLRIILNPAMVVAILLGLYLGGAGRWFSASGWIHAKTALVLGLAAYHGWLAVLRKKFERGDRPSSEKRLRVLNEVPGVLTIAIVILVVVKPF